LDPGLESVRRVHLYRIRHFLYYRVAGDGTIQIVALWHTSRGSTAQL